MTEVVRNVSATSYKYLQSVKGNDTLSKAGCSLLRCGRVLHPQGAGHGELRNEGADPVAEEAG
jgi:hypothetical protein